MKSNFKETTNVNFQNISDEEWADDPSWAMYEVTTTDDFKDVLFDWIHDVPGAQRSLENNPHVIQIIANWFLTDPEFNKTDNLMNLTSYVSSHILKKLQTCENGYDLLEVCEEFSKWLRSGDEDPYFKSYYGIDLEDIEGFLNELENEDEWDYFDESDSM